MFSTTSQFFGDWRIFFFYGFYFLKTLWLISARYLVHYGDWGVVATRSADLNGVPFGLVQSFCDGTYGNSTGRLFFYIAEVSTMYKNMKADPNVSVTITQAESSYCSQQGLDPELPTCARVTLTGLVRSLTLPMLGLLSSKAQGQKDFWKTSKPCHVGIHYIALTEYSQKSTNMPGFQSFFSVFA